MANQSLFCLSTVQLKKLLVILSKYQKHSAPLPTTEAMFVL